jgi:hypothetical protein
MHFADGILVKTKMEGFRCKNRAEIAESGHRIANGLARG